jgi:hypothetical protein
LKRHKLIHTRLSLKGSGPAITKQGPLDLTQKTQIQIHTSLPFEGSGPALNEHGPLDLTQKIQIQIPTRQNVDSTQESVSSSAHYSGGPATCITEHGPLDLTQNSSSNPHQTQC